MPRQRLKIWVRLMEKAFRNRGVSLPKKSSLNIVFMGEKDARALNLQYRKKDYATDVLSFESDEPLGDLVLCPEVLTRQAKEHQLSFFAETGYMVIHGSLHLLGYDHELSKAEARRMFEIQDAVFEELLQKIKN